VRKTWAPVGCTPVLRHSYRRDRVSAISAVTVSPQRRHVGLYFQLHLRNLTGTGVLRFVRHLLRHLRGPVVLLWDGGTIHRRADVTAWLHRHRRVECQTFPSYAPELNPDEFVWTKAKQELSNSDHPEILALMTHLLCSLRRLQGSQRLLWSCIEASDLPWP
jgi:putative transposase